jgi:hypothetical protein
VKLQLADFMVNAPLPNPLPQGERGSFRTFAKGSSINKFILLETSLCIYKPSDLLEFQYIEDKWSN